MSSRVWIVLMMVCWGVAYGDDPDPPTRVARLSYATDAVTPALVNSPLTAGDKVITNGAGSRAEISLGTATIWMDTATEVGFVDLDQDVANLRIAAGTVNVQVRELFPEEDFLLQIHRASVHFAKPGSYRVEVLSNGDAEITVRDGEANVDIGTTSFQQLAGEVALIEASQSIAIQRTKDTDAFDRWSRTRQREFNGKRSAQHIARGIVGYEDLDAYGSWQWVREYGMTWKPTKVAAGWAPYRFGEWIWKAPWGWTWVDATPWGFAPFHYGRWAQLRDQWYWLPGPRQLPPVYAPALVKWTENTADPDVLGWYPLGPGERYTPPYSVSRQHAERLNLFASVSGGSSSAERAASNNDGTARAITWAQRSTFEPHVPVMRPGLEHFASEQ
jgi:hypothetical protein